MARHTPGRHRLGTPGLRHCRDIPSVRERLDELHPGRSLAHSTITPGMTLVVLAVGAAALVVAGWLAGGAPAIADIVNP